MLRALIIFLLTAAPAIAEQVVAGLSQSRIAITTDFDGSEILVFGAIKREDVIDADPPLGVVIAVAGPSEPITVRRKSKRFGIWINTSAVEVDEAPVFYAVATSGEWNEVMRDVDDLRHHVSIRRAIRSVGSDVPDSETFTDALIRIRESKDLYQTNIGAVELSEETLFSTSIRLPANLTEGEYHARFFLTRGGRVVDMHDSIIDVQKVGLERFLFNLSREKPLIYGLMSLAIAIFAGWSASAAFRLIRN